MKQEMLQTHKAQVINTIDINDVIELPARVQTGQIYLITGQSALIVPVVQELVHHFAARGELRVIVGGNRFSLERLPIVLGEDIGKLHEALDRVKISRGETSYQLLHALQETPNRPTPLIVMDMLDSFYDEDLTEREVERVLADSIVHLRRLSARAPVLVSASRQPERVQLLSTLEDCAQHSIELQPDLKGRAGEQLGLF